MLQICSLWFAKIADLLPNFTKVQVASQFETFIALMLPALVLPGGSTNAMGIETSVALVLPAREHECNGSFNMGRPPALSIADVALARISVLVGCSKKNIETTREEGQRGNSASISAATEISDLGQVLQQKTFTRSEIERLKALLHSNPYSSPSSLLRLEASTSGSLKKHGDERDNLNAAITTPMVTSRVSNVFMHGCRHFGLHF
ncbi:hypothetical protein Tco_1057625 [Tanacetum coccineum]|uniref:Uncharacterized protein n=1 Tax=Tanacetum coccineum TaxID=301880 RepID=A0ABQ5H5X6_9ASTR